jgi:hypothetical protein
LEYVNFATPCRSISMLDTTIKIKMKFEIETKVDQDLNEIQNLDKYRDFDVDEVLDEDQNRSRSRSR